MFSKNSKKSDDLWAFSYLRNYIYTKCPIALRTEAISGHSLSFPKFWIFPSRPTGKGGKCHSDNTGQIGVGWKFSRKNCENLNLAKNYMKLHTSFLITFPYFSSRRARRHRHFRSVHPALRNGKQWRHAACRNRPIDDSRLPEALPRHQGQRGDAVDGFAWDENSARHWSPIPHETWIKWNMFLSYLSGQNFGGLECRKFYLLPKILLHRKFFHRKFCPPKFFPIR